MSMRIEYNSQMYVRREENCALIEKKEYPGFTIKELLGVNNGNSKQVSIAVEKFASNSTSPDHYHIEGEECQLVLEGNGTIVIGGKVREIKAGDLVKIPTGKGHRTFTKMNETLKLLCFVTPAWTFEDTVFEKISVSDENCKIYSRRKEECEEFKTDTKESIWELIGNANGSSDKMSVAEVRIKENGSSERHLHKKAEESYYILKGQGTINIDGEERELNPGDLVKIEAGKTHQIFNHQKKNLKFLCVCTPAWTPDCTTKV